MFDKEKAKVEIKKLVEKYNRIAESGAIKKYNEEMTKKDFILPLFRALGWNVENSEEVTAEEKVSRGRVDYGFRIDEIPKFFLEAKALKVDLDKAEYAQQAINYAYHKGTTWAILTDFEGIKVLNAEWKHKNPWQSMFFGIGCNNFIDRFDQLMLLSRESFETGLIDKEAEKWGKKIKKVPVDKQLLYDLTRFRELLTKDILKNNASKNLTGDDLDEAVQRLLDRLIFIRTLEDKHLEKPYLHALIREDRHKRIYKKLNALFRNIDDIYNSKLFMPHLCEDLSISDDVFETVINGLYHTADGTVHYDFGAIDADVLGNMYEQYLGSILKKTPKRAKLTNGKAHRKEQGIYYTPTYVVDYIVKNTVGELAKDKKFDLSKIRILDPACGSGSFLMKAYDYLVTLDKKKNGEIDQTKLDLTGESATYGRKVEILRKNIFGVDLDPKAVEIAQLNLLLKAAEKKHRLPTLQENIKLGNSLIDDKEVAGDKAFKWEEEFKDMMDEGGFDVVIGNPPYVRVDSLDNKEKEFWKTIFSAAQGKYDLYYLFLELTFKLAKDGSIIGFIIPNKFCAATSAINLREIIFSNSAKCSIFSVSGLDVFKDARNYPVIIIVEKGKPNKKFSLSYVKNQKEFIESKLISYKISKKQFEILPSKIFPINISQKEFDIVIRLLSENKKLSDYMQISEGLRIPKEYEEETSSDFEIVKQYQFSKWSPIIKGTFIQSSKLQKVVNPSSKRYINSMQDKILIAEDSLSISATIDRRKMIPQGGVYFGTLIEEESISYLLGLLNSRLLSFIYQILFGGMHIGGGYLRYRSEFLYSLPIKVHNNQSVKNKFCVMIERRLSLTEKLSNLRDKQTDEKPRLEKEIEQLDREIDEQVYRLYGITEEEKAIIEASLK